MPVSLLFFVHFHDSVGTFVNNLVVMIKDIGWWKGTGKGSRMKDGSNFGCRRGGLFIRVSLFPHSQSLFKQLTRGFSESMPYVLVFLVDFSHLVESRLRRTASKLDHRSRPMFSQSCEIESAASGLISALSIYLRGLYSDRILNDKSASRRCAVAFFSLVGWASAASVSSARKIFSTSSWLIFSPALLLAKANVFCLSARSRWLFDSSVAGFLCMSTPPVTRVYLRSRARPKSSLCFSPADD